MYSQQLFEYLERVSRACELDSAQVTLLNDTMGCYLGVLGQMLRAKSDAPFDPVKVTIQLLLLDDGFVPFAIDDPVAEAAHYLIGLGHEQIGALQARAPEDGLEPSPLDSDSWYRMVLAMLHYLAGGHRVQALSALRFLEEVGRRSQVEFSSEVSPYQRAAERLRFLQSARETSEWPTYWDRLLDGRWQPQNFAEERITRLVKAVKERRDITLRHLGRGDVQRWLTERGSTEADAAFWEAYLEQLERRGITTFTPEQVGLGFDQWLRSGTDMLVVLPTGSGKTIIGELRTALSLAEGRQAVWMLPTRAMVRQTKRDLRAAFAPLGKEVAELPVSEDALPQFLDAFDDQESIAVTTPERMAALLRGNPQAVANVGLVVLDEAHILLKETRAETAESVLRTLAEEVPDASLVLMTAFSQAEGPLSALLQALGRTPLGLSSPRRPTRQMCGVIAAQTENNNRYPVISLYPPKVYDGIGLAPKPYRLDMPHHSLKSNDGPIKIAARVVRECTRARLRTIMFVLRKDWAESQASVIANGQASRSLPENDVARLRLEHGEESPVEATSRMSVAPHHGALSRLEQHIVEKWLRKGVLRTVIATPTLAEGVNLPLDVSILTQTTRYKSETNSQEPLKQDEILNMLGRAGRAGYVGDGVCLITDNKRPPYAAYQAHRRVFFLPPEPASRYLGMGRLLQLASGANVGAITWLDQLSGMSFAQAQSLLASVVGVITQTDNTKTGLSDFLRSFPSTSLLSEEELSTALSALVSLSANIRAEIGDDAVLLELLKQTGLPLPALRLMRDSMIAFASEPVGVDLVEWSVITIRDILTSCADYKWHCLLLDKLNTDVGLFDCILAWMKGQPLSFVIRRSQLTANSNRKRLLVVDFLNHGLSLLSQFWGALAVWAEQLNLFGDGTLLQQLRHLPAYVREGVTSLPELVWLREMGGLDRVLAHELAAQGYKFGSYREQRNYVRDQLRQYYQNPSSMPTALTPEQRAALTSVVDELHKHS